MGDSVTYKPKSIQYTYGTTYTYGTNYNVPKQDEICCEYCIHNKICKYKNDFYNFITNFKKNSNMRDMVVLSCKNLMSNLGTTLGPTIKSKDSDKILELYDNNDSND